MKKESSPYYLIFLRLALVPIILLLGYLKGEEGKNLILVCMYIGLLSDIFDGIIARNLGVQTQKIRRLDSQVDMIFWVSIGFCTWFLHPKLIKDNAEVISVIFIMEGLCYLISILKFGKETCTHAFLSKMWGISMLVAFTALIGFNYAGIPFKISIVLGLISHLDRILITLILPHWTHDIPSAYHAYLIRKGKAFKKNKLFN